MILICGLPSSGNHIVYIHVRRGVEAKYGPQCPEGVTRESVQIWHGDNVSPNIKRPEWDTRLMFVCPVRSESMRLRSVEKRTAPPRRKQLPMDREKMRHNVIMLAAQHGARVYNVSYEGLVEDPEGVGRDLFEWLELPWVPWPTERPEGRAPHEGPVFDANEAYTIGT
jgi:hypothetical protein